MIYDCIINSAKQDLKPETDVEFFLFGQFAIYIPAQASDNIISRCLAKLTHWFPEFRIMDAAHEAALPETAVFRYIGDEILNYPIYQFFTGKLRKQDGMGRSSGLEMVINQGIQEFILAFKSRIEGAH